METETVIRNAVDAYDQGKQDVLDALLSDDICYRIVSQPDTGPFVCDAAGKTAFYETVGAILSQWTITDYRIVDLIVSGGRAAAQITHCATHRVTGRKFDARIALFFRVEDGRITEIVEYHDTAALARDD